MLKVLGKKSSLLQVIKNLQNGCSKSFSVSSVVQRPKGKNKTELYKWVLPEGHDTGFKVNNSYACHGTKKIDKKKVPLVVSDHRNIKWYSCGPTVYNSCHIGHASTYLRFDLVRRILSNLYGYKIFVVMGITDVDDKIVARSNLLRQDFSELSKKYEQEFIQNLKQLNISTPHTFVKVSNVIPEIISFIDKLLKNKQAYSTPNGNVWFDHKCLSEDSAFLVHTFDEYDESEFFGGDKKSPRDFALWKAAKDGEPYWQVSSILFVLI